jgi:hypothetical protein
MKMKDITPLTVVYGHQVTHGRPRKAVVLSTAVWTLNTWADRIPGQRAFTRHDTRPTAKFGITIGALVLTAPLDTADAELLAAAAAIDVDQVAETGKAPRTEQNKFGGPEGVGVEVAQSKDIVDLDVVLTEIRESEQRAAAAKVREEAQQAARDQINVLASKLGVSFRVEPWHGKRHAEIPYAELRDLLERLARAEGKL